jgi:hypothetical protein
MNLVWAFNFTTDTDEGGKPIEVDTFDYQKVYFLAYSDVQCNLTLTFTGNFDCTMSLQVQDHPSLGREGGNYRAPVYRSSGYVLEVRVWAQPGR